MHSLFTRIFKCGKDKYMYLFYISSASLIRHFTSAKKKNNLIIQYLVGSFFILADSWDRVINLKVLEMQFPKSVPILPVSHHWLLSSRILTKHRTKRCTCGLKCILIQIQCIEHSVVKTDWRKKNQNTVWKAGRTLKTSLKFIIWQVDLAKLALQLGLNKSYCLWDLSLQYPYNINQISVEEKEKFQFRYS